MSVQAASLGPSIRLGPGYETFWAYIPHFIHSPFYVYAYAFGDCLVNSLYGVYQKAHEGFAERYFALLEAGGAKPYNELLAPFGLDARDPAFWNIGLDDDRGADRGVGGDGGVDIAVRGGAVVFLGERAGARTRDPLIKSQMLYRLSYALARMVWLDRFCASRRKRPGGQAARPLGGRWGRPLPAMVFRDRTPQINYRPERHGSTPRSTEGRLLVLRPSPDRCGVSYERPVFVETFIG